MNFQDVERSKLRTIVADIDRELGGLPAQFAKSGRAVVTDRLASSWAALVEVLALGPEPEVRSCVFCNATIRRAATRCMHCWKQSEWSAEEP